MARTLLDYCISEQTKPPAKEEAKAEAPARHPASPKAEVIKPKEGSASFSANMLLKTCRPHTLYLPPTMDAKKKQ